MTKKVILFIITILWFLPSFAQQTTVFDEVERYYPQLPAGLLEAISFTNTHCHHLTDANYSNPADDSSVMPRAYGMMGLVKDGKGYFRENLKTIAELSELPVDSILNDPLTNVMAYARAAVKMAAKLGVSSKDASDYQPVIIALSELPVGDQRDEYPLNLMLSSVYDYLNLPSLPILPSSQSNIIPSESPDNLSLQSPSQWPMVNGQWSKDNPDYPKALWNPAPDCNFGDRTEPVSGVVVHYTEGSYAGCISWFQNCDAQVSAHYVIRSRDGQVTQMVREADKAWHARSANAYTIGIEHEAFGDIASYFTDAMYQSSADLVSNICSRYESIDGHRTFYRDTLDNGITLNQGLHDLGDASSCVKIRGHQHYPNQSHTDPGPFWDWNYYYKLINEGTPVEWLGGPTVEEGTLNHENYGNDERKIWVIEGPDEATISLEFNTFALERDYDFLWIYDGDNVYAPKIGRWNTRNPGKVTSSGNTMCVEFRSDCATTSSGWKAKWTVNFPEPPEPELPYGVFPNPADNQITIHVADRGFYDAELYDVFGRCLKECRFREMTTMDLSDLAHGVYIIRYAKVGIELSAVKRIVH